MSNAHVQRNQTLLLRPTNEVFSSSPDMFVLFLYAYRFTKVKQIVFRRGNVRRFLSIAQPPKDTHTEKAPFFFEITIRVGHPKYFFFGLFSS